MKRGQCKRRPALRHGESLFAPPFAEITSCIGWVLPSSGAESAARRGDGGKIMTSLPDYLWSDPRCLYLKKRRRRLWMLLCDMERLRAGWHPDDVAGWPECVWAAYLEITERRLTLDLAELRHLGLIAPDRIALLPCRSVPKALLEQTPADREARAPRPRYPSDERRSRQGRRDAAIPPPSPSTDSATTPPSLRADSADAPQNRNAEPADAPPPTPLLTHERAGLSQAKLSQASSANTESQSLAGPGLAASGRAPATPTPNGNYRHRAYPNSEEIAELQTRFSRDDIEEAIRRVQRRPHFDGAGHWVRYLAPVLCDIESEKQAAPPATGRSDLPNGVTDGPRSQSPPMSPPTALPQRETPRRERPRFEPPSGGFAALRHCLPPIKKLD